MMDADVQKISEMLEIPVPRLYLLSNQRIVRTKRKKNYRYANYHKVVIHKGSGHKNRILSVPNDYLKLVQRRILERYLYTLPVSGFATAYQPGTALLQNAVPHVGKECILKLDISQFFDSIDTDMVYAVMKELGLSVPATTLLTYICIYNGKLPQGAPTSPCIANLVMRRFDEGVGEWCKDRNIAYTRYCDDMTFSGKKSAIRESGLLRTVSTRLYHMGFSLNQEKTNIIPSSQQQRVTGIVMNEKPTISREERRKLRQEVYYCRKSGVKDTITHRGLEMDAEHYLHSLLGRLTFAMKVSPEQKELREWFEEIRRMQRTG